MESTKEQCSFEIEIFVNFINVYTVNLMLPCRIIVLISLKKQLILYFTLDILL